MLKSLRFWIGLAATLLFLFLLFRNVNIERMADAFLRADYRYLAPAIAVFFVAFAFRAYRWRYLLHHLKPVPIPFRPLFRILSIGYMANNILPLRAGEIVRSYLLGQREGISKTSVLGSILVERTLDGLVLVFFLAIFLPVAMAGAALSPVLAQAWVIAAAIFGLAFLGLLTVVLLPGLTLAIARIVFRLLPGRLRATAESLLSRFITGFQVLRNPRFLLFSFALSVPVWLGEAVMYYLIALGFDLDVSFAVILIATALANLILSVPSSQGGIGPFEFAVSQTVVLFGVIPETAAAYALLLHIALLAPITLVGLYFLWTEGISLRVTLGTAGSSPAD